MDNTLDDLKTRLEMKGIEGENKITEEFSKIADILLQKVKIQKGDKKYLITEIEFYWYTNAHRDIITYPRKCPAGMWYFHSSGVDISFESHVTLPTDGDDKRPILDENARFGGILIRSIKPDGWNYIGKKGALTGHPLNVVDELFDHIDAFGNPEELPKLIAEPHSAVIQDKEREGLTKDTPENKVKKIVNNYKKGCITDEFQKELAKSYTKFANYQEKPDTPKEPHIKYGYKVIG
jgi:hypothetical protein